MLKTLKLYIDRQASGLGRYLVEQTILTLFGWIPTIIGIGIRGIIYRLILKMNGIAAIENGVRLVMCSNIKLEKGVYLDRGVYLLIAAVAALTGINLFALGITFNYLVALLNKRSIRQGLFGKPIFNPPLDRHFGWLGIILLLGGLLLGGFSLGLGINGWEIGRIWLYLLLSAMLILIGLQMLIYWIIFRVLDELSQREDLVQKDLAFNLSGNSAKLDFS